MKKFLLGFIALLSVVISTLALDPKLEPFIPSGAIVKHTEYATRFDSIHKTPVFVIYHLNKALRVQNVTRAGMTFKPDPLIPGSVTQVDYAHDGGFDIGHHSPAEDNATSKELMAECFLTGNVAPQLAAFNRGIWKQLENQVRDWADEGDDLVIICGDIFTDKDTKTIGQAKIGIPGYFYKIVYDMNTQRCSAFLFPHEALEHQEASDYEKPLAEVQKAAGIEFIKPSTIKGEIPMKASRVSKVK